MDNLRLSPLVNKNEVYGLIILSCYVFCNLALMHCRIRNGHLLEDGMFALSMQCYWGSVRKYIDLRMKENHCGLPLVVYKSYKLMWDIAFGMWLLHRMGVLRP